MIWNKEMECATRQKMNDIQLEQLKATVKHVYKNVEFYRKRLDEAGIGDKITSLDDLKRVPFTTKEDLRQHYPYGTFAVPLKEIVRLHASSGTTGKPTVVGYTRHDIDMWSESCARFIAMAGVDDTDIAQIAFGYGLFTGALGLHFGLEKVGASVIPISGGNTEKQFMVMKDFGTTALICTPSYAVYMGEALEEYGYKKSDLKLKYGLFGGEGHTLEMNAEIEKKLGILALENYGLSEVGGPGVSGECEHKVGMHIAEDLFIPEVINPETGEVLPYGAEGELVITTINKEGFPVLRYRTKDITSLIPEQCKCGRTSIRMTKCKGRSDDMLIIRGVNVYPSQIEGVIIGMEHISPFYQLVLTKKDRMDVLEVQIEVVDESLLERYSELEALENKLKAKLHSVLGLNCKVRLREPMAIERTVGKSKRVLDLRNQ